MDTERIVVEARMGCFTLPACVTERVSSEIPPPSAVKGICEAIFWKPEFRYHVVSVAKVPHSSGEPTSLIPVMTNEVERGDCEVNVDTRVQRRSYLLRYPAFLIEVGFLSGSRAPTKRGHNLLTYSSVFRRRVEMGQYYTAPFLGIREFLADFRLATDADVPVNETRSLGTLAYIAWSHRNYLRHGATGVRVVEHAMMVNGRVDMNEWTQ